MELIFFWILFAFFGFLLGLITGLIPGLHVNNIAVLALVVASGFEESTRLLLVILIVSMSLTHSFMEFIPSILFFFPDSDNFLALLPGQKMFLQGRAFQAIYLTAVAGLLAGFLSILILFPLTNFFSALWSSMKEITWLLLFIVLCLMIFEERGFKKQLFVILIILLSGSLGFIAFEMLFLSNALFSLIVGFFGLSTALTSIQAPNLKIKQSLELKPLKKLVSLKMLSMSLFSGLFIALMPGLSPALTAIIIRQLIGFISVQEFLFIIGSVSTINFVFSFSSLIALGKTRTGAALAVKNLMELTEEHIILIAGVSLLVIPLAFFACLLIAKFLVKRFHLINLKSVLSLIILFQLSLVFFFSGVLGLIVSLTALAISLLAVRSGVKRSTCMACIIIPTIIRFF